MGKNERRSFSEEFNVEAVRRAEVVGHSFTQIARELGIHLSLLQTWRRKFASAVRDAVNADKGSSQEGELRRLRRENAALREDREILKKAATFFAKESRSNTRLSRSRERCIACAVCASCLRSLPLAIMNDVGGRLAVGSSRIKRSAKQLFELILIVAARMAVLVFMPSYLRRALRSASIALDD